MATIQTNLTCELQNGSVAVQYLNGVLFSQDNQANQINVAVYDNGEPATISGTVTANIIRADGGTVTATGGSISGNVASIAMPSAAYAVPGVASIIVKLSTSGVVTTLAAVVANIYESSTATAIDPGTIIPSVTALVAQIDAAVATIPANYSNLWTTLAPAFSTSATYSPGQYVTYDQVLYRFTAAHTGNWSSSDVVAANIGNDLSDLKNALNAEPTVSSAFAQGARGANTTITSRTDRCTTASTYALSAGDRIKVVNPTQRISVIAGTNNNAFVYDGGWQSGNVEYVVTEQTAGTYFVNFAYSISGENITPSNLSGVSIEITLKTAITELQTEVFELANIVDSLQDSVVPIVGEELVPTVQWERGTIVDGADSSSTTRVRSDFIDVSEVANVSYTINSGYKFFYVTYDSGETFISNSTWLTGSAEVTFSSNVNYIRICIAKSNDGTNDCADTRQLTVVAYKQLSKSLKDIDGSVNGLQNNDEISLKSWNIGYIYRTGGVDTTAQPNYCCTTAMVKFPFDVCISIDNGYQFVVLTFNTSGAVSFGSSWLYDNYIIHAGTYFGLNLSKTTPEAVADIDDYIPHIHIRSTAVWTMTSPASTNGLRMSVLGDSISTFDGWIESGVKAAHYPRYDITDVYQMWWYIVADALNMLDDLAVSAISSSAYYDYNNDQYPPVWNTARIARLGMYGAPDLIFVYAGVNDGFVAQDGSILYDYNVSALEAMANSTVKGIELTMRKLQTSYPSARIVVLIPQQVKMSDMPSGYDLERVQKIADEIKSCAELFGAWKVIDLRACGINQTNVAGFCGDGNIHPNEKGMRCIADYILEQLR